MFAAHCAGREPARIRREGTELLTDSRDERAIYRNIVRIARAMDERDWAVVEEIIVPEATGDFGTGPLGSASEIVALLRDFLDDCGPTQHMIGNVLIEIDDNTAVSRAYVSDMHLGTGDLEGQFFRTLGDYHDSWVRTSEGWRLIHRTKKHTGLLGNIAVLPAASS
ncbi:nuclear transport factor 2 family protein [Rhodococcus sp. (in: high G+C Gram-positive bacteria)]|uniref:nuclear transport factor 2 family protein n=1 Tax=Rhodococcus sp. TaxID=1831 RepID=UPI00388FE9C5